MMKLIAEVEGIPQFDRTFTRFDALLSDFRQLWPGVIPELRNAVRDQYSGRGVGPSGTWRPLTAGYARWKEKHFPGRSLMVRTGATHESLTRNTSRTVLIQRPDSLTFGTSVPYAIYHQRGNKRLPKRAIFDLNEAQKTRITKAVQRRLIAAGRNNGVTLS